LQRTVIRPLTQPFFRGVRSEALAIRFSFPMWRTVSSARRDGIPRTGSRCVMPVMVVSGSGCAIVPDLDTESTALDDAVTPDEARGLRVSVGLSEQS